MHQCGESSLYSVGSGKEFEICAALDFGEKRAASLQGCPFRVAKVAARQREYRKKLYLIGF